jgi:hypothetical protein
MTPRYRIENPNFYVRSIARESEQAYTGENVLVRLSIQLILLAFSCSVLLPAPQVNEDSNALLDRIRDKMKAYMSLLPNYTCHEVIDRFGRPMSSGQLNHLDTVEVEVAFVGNRELFASAPDGRFEEQSITKIIPNGTIGNGTFGSHVAALFTGSAATFKYAGVCKKGGHQTMRYDFVVPQEKSQLVVRHQPVAGVVGYRGSFWVDSETLDLVRLELKADHIPSYIGVSLVQDVMEYKPLHIRNVDFLLPYKSRLAAEESTGFYYMNMVKLDNCKEFSGESVVTFGGPADDPSGARATPNQ